MVDYQDAVIKVEAEKVSSNEWKVKAGKYEILIGKGGILSPSPLQYLLASLAGCLQITAGMVAEEMKINLEDLKVEIEAVFNPAGFYGKDKERVGFKEIKAILKIKSDQSEEKLKELLAQVEKRCPVSDNLVNPTPVEITVVKG